MTLATTVIPQPGEAVDGYLDRASHQLRIPVAALLSRLPNSPVTGPTPCWISPATAEVLADDLGLTSDEIQGMHLAGAFPHHYGSLGHEPDLPAVNRAAKNLWFSMAGSRYCPKCLAEDGIWKLAWRLPWSIACLNHGSLLRDSCPGCGQAPRSGRHGTSRSLHRYGSVRNPKLCHNQNREPGVGQAAPECGRDLTTVTARPARRRLARVQRRLDRILAGRPATVAGIQLSASPALQAWRELLVIDRHLSGGHRDGARSWYALPTADQTIDSVQRMSPIIEAATAQDAAASMRQHLGPEVDANWFRDRLPADPVLDSVYAQSLMLHGRVSTQLRRLSAGRSQQPPLPSYNYTGANVPQLIPVSWLPQILRERKGKPSQAMLQAVLALAGARLVEGDWTDAARALELPESKGRQWSHYVISHLSHDEKQALVETVMRLASGLSSKETLRDYSADRIMLATARELADISMNVEPRPG